jgi:hypothetical protein
MERYWCLRWLLQERIEEAPARVVRESLVRFEVLPLSVRLPEMPALVPGTRVRVRVGAVDLLEESLDCRYVGLIEDTAGAAAEPPGVFTAQDDARDPPTAQGDAPDPPTAKDSTQEAAR